MIPAFDAYVLGRILIGKSIGDSAANLSPTYRSIATDLDGIELASRQTAFRGIIAGRSDADELIHAITNVNPDGSPPPVELRRAVYATLEDLKKVIAGQAWAWEGYLALGVFNPDISSALLRA